MSFSKEQWQVIEEQLSFPYSQVKLKCDGYEVSAMVKKIKGLKFCVTVYVDGVYKGEWMDGKHEGPLKFHCKKRRYFLNGKRRQDCIRELSKRGTPAASKKCIKNGWISITNTGCHFGPVQDHSVATFVKPVRKLN
jgi:hypothetical protein